MHFSKINAYSSSLLKFENFEFKIIEWIENF